MLDATFLCCVNCRSLSLVGTEIMDEGYFPSDHFGLLFEFSISGSGGSGSESVVTAIEEHMPLQESSKRRKV